jgi:hypothetical protein
MRAHPDPVAEDGASREGTGRIDRQDAHGMSERTDMAYQLIDQRTLAGTRRTGDTNHSRDAAAGVQLADQRAALHRFVLHERNRTRERTRIAAAHGCGKRRELHAHLRDPE